FQIALLIHIENMEHHTQVTLSQVFQYIFPILFKLRYVTLQEVILAWIQTFNVFVENDGRQRVVEGYLFIMDGLEQTDQVFYNNSLSSIRFQQFRIFRTDINARTRTTGNCRSYK